MENRIAVLNRKFGGNWEWNGMYGCYICTTDGRTLTEYGEEGDVYYMMAYPTGKAPHWIENVFESIDNE